MDTATVFDFIASVYNCQANRALAFLFLIVTGAIFLILTGAIFLILTGAIFLIVILTGAIDIATL
eukprot:6731240-Ditylum_brightwellii.AAC.1